MHADRHLPKTARRAGRVITTPSAPSALTPCHRTGEHERPGAAHGGEDLTFAAMSERRGGGPLGPRAPAWREWSGAEQCESFSRSSLREIDALTYELSSGPNHSHYPESINHSCLTPFS